MALANGAAAVPRGLRPDHPYYPPGVVIPNYAPNTTPLWLLFVYFGSALGAFLTATFVIARLVKPRFRFAAFSDKSLFVWFTLCRFRRATLTFTWPLLTLITAGGLHWFFEGTLKPPFRILMTSD